MAQGNPRSNKKLYEYLQSNWENQNWAAIRSSGVRPSKDIVPQFLGLMTALTDTSSPELPHSLIVNAGLV